MRTILILIVIAILASIALFTRMEDSSSASSPGGVNPSFNPNQKLPDREVTILIQDDVTRCNAAFGERDCIKVDGQLTSEIPRGFEYNNSGDIIKVIAIEKDRGASVRDVARFYYVLVEEIERVNPDSVSPVELCGTYGGDWLGEYNECVGPDSTYCELVDGEFNGCASPCRNDPSADICIERCDSVCSL